MQNYTEIHLNHTGKSSDKWESYLPVYDRLFSPFRDNSVNILQIGVHNGGSLEVLAKYFRQAVHIIGSDTNPSCGDLKYDDPRISIVVGNINTQEVLDSITSKLQAIDLLIDDGSHTSADVVATFVNYFQLVSPGGLYIIEDTHSLYWEAAGGGVLRGHSAQQLFKLLTDVVNLEHWQRDLPLNTYLSTFFLADAIPDVIAEGWVEGIEFLNSLIVVRKARRASHAKLGSPLVVGAEFPVEPETDTFKRPQ
jgi:hypothetical protein